MRMSASGLDLIKSYEGLSLTPYMCPAGKPTIGYGHVILPGQETTYRSLTLEQAESLLADDLVQAESTIDRLVVVCLNQYQFDALGSFIYNIGCQAFEKSMLLRLLNNGNPLAAAEQFTKWVYAKGTKLKGLELRRAAERQLFLKNPQVS